MRASQRPLRDGVQGHRYPCHLSLLPSWMELEKVLLIPLSIVEEDVSTVMRWQSVSVVCFDRICAMFSFSRNLRPGYCCALEHCARMYQLMRGSSLELSIDVDENRWSCDALDSMCYRREHWNGYDGYGPEKTMGYNRNHSIDHSLTNLSSQYDDNRWGQSKRRGEDMASRQFVVTGLTVFDRCFIFDVFEERSSDLYELFCSRCIVLRTTSKTIGD
jgi:hypothetical protein